jgi:hypothetical protein
MEKRKEKKYFGSSSGIWKVKALLRRITGVIRL